MLFDWMTMLLSTASLACAVFFRPDRRFAFLMSLPVCYGLLSFLMVPFDRSPIALALSVTNTIVTMILVRDADR